MRVWRRFMRGDKTTERATQITLMATQETMVIEQEQVEPFLLNYTDGQSKQVEEQENVRETVIE